MIHTSRTVTVGKMESVINEPIMLYRGDREVEIEFDIVGSKFMFSNGGNVIKSTNATNGQLVINTPTGENMFSEVTECNDGKVICVITKEMIDELAEVGFYSFQIRLFDESQVSRVTIPPVYQGIEIRNPIAAEDETDLVDIGLVDFSVVRKDNYENVVTFLPNGDYNKTLWEEHDVISKDRLNKVEDALYEINKGTEGLYPTFQNQYDEFSAKVNKDVKAYKEEMEDEVEQFERDMTQAFGEFKVDYKDEVHERLDIVEGELEDIQNDLSAATIVLSPKMYGCIGDGLTDDTLNFQKCINDAVKQGGIINGLGKTYMISDIQQLPSHIESKDYGLYIEGSLYMYNCNFILKSGCVGRTTILNIANPKNTNVILDNIYIDGNGNSQSTTVTSQDGGMHGIRVSYSNMDVEVGGFEIRNSVVTTCYSDCICIRPNKFDFCNIKNSKIILGGRNGITDNAYSSVVENCQFIDNGWRTAPNSGYHIEPDNSKDFGRKVMRDCVLTNSQGADYKIHYNSNIYNMDALIIENCSMRTLGIAHYCETECYTNDIIINNSTISRFTSGNDTNVCSLHVIRNVKVNNSRIGFMKWESVYEPTEFGDLFFTNTIFNLGDGNIYLYGDYNVVSFDKCMFTKEFDDADAIRNNCFYFDYQTLETLTGPQTTKKVAFTNCVFNNINRCVSLGDNTSRLIDNFIFKDNIVNNRHLAITGSSVKNAIIDGNTFRHTGTNVPGTAGKIRFGANCNTMIATNNIFFMNELAAFGPNTPVNCIKANNLFDITE